VSELRVENVCLRYESPDRESFLAVDNVSLTVQDGEFVAIVGPSGCGKSSLLFMVNGIAKRTSGVIRLGSAVVAGPSPSRALVFQEFALLPWRSIIRNVEFGLELMGVDKSRRREVAMTNLALVGLAQFENHLPHQLSGGMRQRVGIARALSVQPDILLMDEPFGALDAQTRQVMGTELLRIWERSRTKIIFVTHDIDEAIYLADRIIIMSASPGRIIDEIEVNLPRPRVGLTRSDPRFAKLHDRIWKVLESEVQESLARQFASNGK
jgi:NitT/TauT family transport system ATP-binding protein